MSADCTVTGEKTDNAILLVTVAKGGEVRTVEVRVSVLAPYTYRAEGGRT